MTQTALSFLYKHSPSLFAEEMLGFAPDEHQKEYLDSKADQVLLLWARQTGKTTASAAKAVHYAIYNPGHLVLIASASQKQAAILQGRALGMIRYMHRTENWKPVGEGFGYENDPISSSRLIKCAVMSLQMESGAEIISVPASPETVRGYSPHLIILDEAAYIDDEVYDSITPMRLVTRAQIIAMSTAGPKQGWFYDAWTAGTKHWQRLEIKAKDCPRADLEFLKQERETKSDLVYMREYENQFFEIAGGLFTEEDIKGMELDELGIEAIAKPWVPDDLSVDVYE